MRRFPCGWSSLGFRTGKFVENFPRLSVSSGRSIWTTGLSPALQLADFVGFVAALAEAINSLVAEPASAERMGAAGRKRGGGGVLLAVGGRADRGALPVADRGVLIRFAIATLGVQWLPARCPVGSAPGRW